MTRLLAVAMLVALSASARAGELAIDDVRIDNDAMAAKYCPVFCRNHSGHPFYAGHWTTHGNKGICVCTDRRPAQPVSPKKK